MGPITISSGGTYSGTYETAGTSTVITIATSAPVVIENATVRGGGKLIYSTQADSDVTIRNTRFEGVYPGGTNIWGWYGVEVHDFASIVVEHCHFEQKAGIKLQDAAGPDVTIRYNTAHNIDGRRTDGAGGYSGWTFAQFVQLDTVTGCTAEIAWNQIENDPDDAASEDIISLYASSGLVGAWINVHDNYIRGNWPFPSLASGYNGGGIMLGDHGGSYQQAHHNQVVAATNYGVANSGGEHMSIHDNRIVSSGRRPDNTLLPSANVGTYCWNEWGGAWTDNSDYDNVVGWMQYNGGTPIRNDLYLPDCNGTCTGNTSLHAGTITLSDEDDELSTWTSKLAANGITLGIEPALYPRILVV